MKAPVANPCALSRVAIVGWVAGNRYPVLSRTPCSYGYRPERIDECETSVTTACACANSKRAPRAASRSRLGVETRPPLAPSASARQVSIVTSKTFRSGLTLRTNVGGRSHHHALRARTTATETSARTERGRLPVGGGGAGGARRAVR